MGFDSGSFGFSAGELMLNKDYKRDVAVLTRREC
jgi:hypothetical protein